MITTGVVRESSEAASRGAEMITKVAKETSAKNARQWQKQGAKITALTVIMALFAPLNLMTSVGFSPPLSCTKFELTDGDSGAGVASSFLLLLVVIDEY